jgi:hypothetical protein
MIVMTNAHGEMAWGEWWGIVISISVKKLQGAYPEGGAWNGAFVYLLGVRGIGHRRER